MARLQSSTAVFTKAIGVEGPPIAGLQCAAFFGDGSVNPQDGTNLIKGGSTFSNIGSGPVMSPTYGTFTATTNSLNLGMVDAFPNAMTIIFAAATPQVVPATVVQFSTLAAAGSAIWFSGKPTSSIGPVTASADILVTTSVPNLPAFPAWGLYAWVINPGSLLTLYDITRNIVMNSTVNVTTPNSNRPTAGAVLQVGCAVPNGGSNKAIRVAFALGAASLMSQAQLNTFAAALRFPLAARGIVV